jgi:hypothetical protein
MSFDRREELALLAQAAPLMATASDSLFSEAVFATGEGPADPP